jgi:hypothetical protein
VLAVHCRRVQREKTATFKVLTRPLTVDKEAIVEVQFAGSTIGHQLH